MWQRVLDVDEQTELRTLHERLVIFGAGALNDWYYFWLLNLLLAVFLVLSVFVAVPLCVSNANGDNLSHQYGVARWSNNGTATALTDAVLGNSTLALTEAFNNKFLHFKLDTTIFNMDKDGSSAQYTSQVLSSVLLMLTTVALVSVSQLGSFMFESMQRRTNQVSKEFREHAHRAESIGDVSVILEATSEDAMLNLLLSAWGNPKKVLTDSVAEYQEAYAEKIDPATQGSADLEEHVKELVMNVLKEDIENEAQESVREVFVPLGEVAGSRPRSLKIFVSFKDSATSAAFCESLQGTCHPTATMNEMIHMDDRTSCTYREVTLTQDSTWLVQGGQFGVDPPSNIIFDGMYQSMQMRTVYGFLYLLFWVSLVIGLSRLCVLFLELNYIVEGKYRHAELMTEYVWSQTLLIILLPAGLAVTVGLVDVLSQIGSSWLNFPDRVSSAEGMYCWQSLVVASIVMPTLALPQVMDWGDDGHIYGFNFGNFENRLGYNRCAKLYGGDSFVNVNATSQLQAETCSDLQLVSAGVLWNSLISCTFINALTKWSGITERLSRGFFLSVYYPLRDCCADRSSLHYNEVLDCFKPWPFDLSFHTVRILYILILGLAIGPGMPIAFCTTWLSLFMQQRVDRWYFFTRAVPTLHNGQIGARTIPKLQFRIIRIIIFLHIVCAAMWWQFTTSNFLDIAVNGTATVNNVFSSITVSHRQRSGPGTSERALLVLAPLVSLALFVMSVYGCGFNCIGWLSWKAAQHWEPDHLEEEDDGQGPVEQGGKLEAASGIPERRATTNLESFVMSGSILESSVVNNTQLEAMRRSTMRQSLSFEEEPALVNRVFDARGESYRDRFIKWTNPHGAHAVREEGTPRMQGELPHASCVNQDQDHEQGERGIELNVAAAE